MLNGNGGASGGEGGGEGERGGRMTGGGPRNAFGVSSFSGKRGANCKDCS